jgi:hypothetical protein
MAAVMLAGCGGTPEKQDDGVVTASDTTKQELGVTRWYTKGAPTSIEGHDGNDQVVVNLRHEVTHGDSAAIHTFTLKEHEREATRTYSFANNATGADQVLEEQFSPYFDPEHVLDLLSADVEAKQSSGSSVSLVASFGVSDLHPQGGSNPGDTTDNVPNQPETPLVVCSETLVDGQILLFKKCLGQYADPVLCDQAQCQAYVPPP